MLGQPCEFYLRLGQRGGGLRPLRRPLLIAAGRRVPRGRRERPEQPAQHGVVVEALQQRVQVARGPLVYQPDVPELVPLLPPPPAEPQPADPANRPSWSCFRFRRSRAAASSSTSASISASCRSSAAASASAPAGRPDRRSRSGGPEAVGGLREADRAQHGRRGLQPADLPEELRVGRPEAVHLRPSAPPGCRPGGGKWQRQMARSRAAPPSQHRRASARALAGARPQ